MSPNEIGPSTNAETDSKVIATTETTLPGRTASRRKAHRALDREPWKKARGEREAPHPVFVEVERHRVICRECPWFWVRVGATYLELREMGKRHRANMREAGR